MPPEEVWKVSKPMIQSILAPAKDVVIMLDAVAQFVPHPAITVSSFNTPPAIFRVY